MKFEPLNAPLCAESGWRRNRVKADDALHGPRLAKPLASMLGVAGVLAVLGWSAPAISANYGTVCQDCAIPERQACALETAIGHNLSDNDEVWVFDLENVEAERFSVYSGYIQGDAENPHSAFGSGQPRTGTLPNVVSIPFTSHQQNDVSDGMRAVNAFVLPNGGQIFQQCYQSPSGRIVAETNSSTRGGDGAVFEEFTLPPSAYESAYDVIGNESRGIAIGDWWMNSNPETGYLAGLFNLADNLLDIPFNVEVALIVTFSDGSFGILFPAPNGLYVADFETFRDSDGNPIPELSGDIENGHGFDFSGSAPGENNLENFLDRLRTFGIPITGPGGGGPLPTQCRMEDGRFICVRI